MDVINLKFLYSAVRMIIVTFDDPTNPELLFLAHALHVSLIVLGKANLGGFIQLCPLLGGENIFQVIFRDHHVSLLFL